MLPLRRSVLLLHLLSSLQPPLEVVDDDLFSADLGPDGRSILLDSGVAKQQDIPAALAGVAVLVEFVGIPVRVKDHVSGCDEVDLSGVTRVGDKESAISLDGWGNFGADGESKGSGEGLSNPEGGVGGGDGLVHLGTGRADDL